MGENIFNTLKEYKSLAKRYKELRGKYRQLKENMLYGEQISKLGSWTYDIREEKMFFTQGVYNILESSNERSLENVESYYRFVHPDDLKKVKEAAIGSRNGKEYNIGYRIITRTGTQKYIHEIAKVLYDKEDNPIKVVGIIQDITSNKLVENNLYESEEHLNQAQRLAGIGSWKYDVKKDTFYGSDEMFRIYDIDPSEFKSDFSNTLKLVHPDDRGILQKAMKAHLEGKVYEDEFRILKANGEVKYVLGKGEPICGKDGQVIAVLGVLQDITEKKELQKKVKGHQEEVDKIQKRFATLIKESLDVFEILQPDGTITYISEASEKVIGHKPEERIGKKIYDYYEESERRNIANMIDFVIENPDKGIQRDVCLVNKMGKKLYLEIHMQNFLHEPTIDGIVVNFRDITKRVEAEDRISYISTHDQLTGLPNFLDFKKKCRLYFGKPQKINANFAIFILDIDSYRYIKNILGFQIGRRYINEIAKKLTLSCKGKYICRYSDNRFIIIIEGVDRIEGYETIIEELYSLFSYPLEIGKYKLDVDLSIGISTYRNDVKDSDQLIRHAETALYLAKNEGKNRYKFYSRDLDIQSYKEFILRNDLRDAIENNELTLYYQPIVNLRTNEILAAEVLIRWAHPEWGLVSPVEFISIAEETGYIIKIGHWLLEQVCRHYREWLDNGLPNIKMAINFSSIQFLEANFKRNVKETIDKYGLKPDFLIMEITENILLKKSDTVISDINELRALGVQIALDDFGTGYSSLAYLSTFNIDILKIDGSFTTNVIKDETSTIIISHIIKMAQDLKIKLVAEHIETWEQLSFLKGLRCYTGQGYIFSRPLPLKDFENILPKRECLPIRPVDSMPFVERRKFFRVRFSQALEASLMITEIKGRKIDVGNTKVAIKDIGPGGLCFVSHLRLPVERDVILQFTMGLLGEKLRVHGYIVWAEEVGNNLFKYGIEFIIDENGRSDLIKVLSQVQIKMRNNTLFADGSFISGSIGAYFGRGEQL